MNLESHGLAALSCRVAIALDLISRKKEANLGDIEKMSEWFATNLSFSTHVDTSRLIIAWKVMDEVDFAKKSAELCQTLKAVATIRCILEDILHDGSFVQDTYPETLEGMKKFFLCFSKAISAELPAYPVL